MIDLSKNVVISEADINAVFDAAKTSEDVNLGIHRLAIPQEDWDRLNLDHRHLQGWPECNLRTWKQIYRRCILFDQKHPTPCKYPGDLWFHCGFSHAGCDDLADGEVTFRSMDPKKWIKDK